MIRCSPLVLLAATLSVVPAPSAQPPAKTRKVAFLVGVGKYDHKFGDLGTAPENDVTELAKALAGFEVVTLTGSKPDGDPQRATKENIEARFKELLKGTGGKRSIRDGDTVLVLLCGHGIEDGAKPQPYFCPVDARPNDVGTMVPLNALVRESEAFGGTSLFLVDACREVPPEANRARTGIQGKQVALPDKTAVLFACGSGQLSHQSDKLGRGHGLFTHAVLKTLKTDERVTWTGLVHGVEKEFETDALRALIPEGRTQQPVEAKGQLGATELLPGRAAGGTGAAAVVKPNDPPAAVADTAKGEKEIATKSGIRLVRVTGGKFQMGSPANDEDADKEYETPAHARTVAGFYMGVTEVTRKQYVEVDGGTAPKDDGEFPKTNITWVDAVRFCNKLSKHEGLRECYDVTEAQVTFDPTATGYRLPTEAEWEYACRGGGAARWASGNSSRDLGSHAWFKDNSDSRPHPCGKKQANAFGLHDMHGNAAEWCWDTFATYTDPAKVVPTTLKIPDTKVVRGGAFNSLDSSCRSAARKSQSATVPDETIGFRVVRSIKP